MCIRDRFEDIRGVAFDLDGTLVDSAPGLAAAVDMAPVSYTHLDVYKRQPWKQALQTVVKSAGLITRQEGNILSVHSVAWQNDNIARQEAEQTLSLIHI